MNSLTLVYADNEIKTDTNGDLLLMRHLDSIKPICFVCKKPVDHIERLYNAMKATHVFIAKCHGQQESIELDRMTCTFHTIAPGYAFTNKLLSELEKPEC